MARFARVASIVHPREGSHPSTRSTWLAFLGLLGLFGLGCSSGDAPIARTTCPPGQTACGLRCLDLSQDPVNCGGCGIPCSGGRQCVGGLCQCVSGGVVCNDACFAPEANPCATDGLGAGGAGGSAMLSAKLVTSAPDAYWTEGGTVTVASSGNADVTVLDASSAQTWEGFGGAFNERGWEVLSWLSAEDRDAAIRLLFGVDGARFSFGRIPIGASDYALDRYTLDETPLDPDLASFSLERDKRMLIPFIKAAQAQKANIRFWASPWTPPTWMKRGPFSAGPSGSPFDGGSMKDDEATLTAFAQYLIKFVRAYAGEGIKIETISPQNEPNYTGTYPTCSWSPATYLKFVGQFLGPALAQTDLDTKVMLGTFNGGGSDSGILSTVMGDTAARGRIDVLGFQWGMLGRVGSASRYDVPIWETEHKCGNYPWLSPFKADAAPNDQAYARESWGLIRDWIKAGVTAYSAWNMVLDTVGNGIDSQRTWPQDALLTVDATTKRLIITPAYYVFRHVSQFVPSGSKVVATSGGDALAFKRPDGGIVTVISNTGRAKTMIVAVAGQRLQFDMPADGWATLLWEGAPQ